MASDCIFYSEDHDMGATIPFCNFEDSSAWNCCEYYGHTVSTQELCPHYISKKDGLEILRRSKRKAGVTNLEKLVSTLTLDELHHAFCKRNLDPNLGCLNCPIYSPSRPCRRMGEVCDNFSEWLDEEAEDNVFEKENALKLIDRLEATNDTLRRELIMSDAITSIGKEQHT